MPDIWDTPEGKLGREVEDLLLSWMRRTAYVLSVRDYSGKDDTRAPMICAALDKVILPDFLCSRGGLSWWVEAKAKTNPLVWRKEGGALYHGIENRQREHYAKVAAITGLRVDLIVCEKRATFLYLRDLISKPGIPLGTGRIESGRNAGVFMINYRREWFREIFPGLTAGAA